MESPGYPETWMPYMTPKDCSQGLCSFYCPQWCSVALPPPPTFRFSDDENPGPTFSPLIIAIIGILASAFLLVSYYTLISNCCGGTSSRRREIYDPDEQLEENRRLSVQEPWQVATGGLDEALIKSIAVCRYKKDDGGVTEGTCSVCLSEFQEDESIRLLPKCTHAFHVPCIDMWLKSHSNCPLCRSDVIFIVPSASPAPTPALATDGSSLGNEPSLEIHQEESEDDNSPAAQDSGSAHKTAQLSSVPKTPSLNSSDLRNHELVHTVIEVREGSSQTPQVRRSFSMDHLCQTWVSVSGTSLQANGQERLVIRVDECTGNAEAGPANHSLGEVPKADLKRRLLHLHCVCGVSPATLKRSFSSGRISILSWPGRPRNAAVPI
ncbi:RING-H2 finger protein ATL51-like isoform X2 [Rhodamnia argentea]|nr:RING-H2 finger protein ATL51-like isoform X2 [Rhodamnia argentea]XP_030533684.1 RING-H2 finger protein ATL51-like isoform X2 [Rhodamnia argentea]XP_030533685.1 RING-H2 finger protein ATL51-like isoform X2 [Rhodamnia argentea]